MAHTAQTARSGIAFLGSFTFFGPLVLCQEKGFFYPMVDEIPGEHLILTAFTINIKIRIDGGCFERFGPVPLIVPAKQEDVGDPPVTA